MTSTNTTPFKALFGVDEQDMKKRCILMPFAIPAVLKHWQLTGMSRGLLYKVAHTRDFSVIHTRMGAGLTGDAALYLKETPCEELFLFGSCGQVEKAMHQGLGLGSCVLPTCCFALESFSDFLLNKQLLTEKSGLRCFYPDELLLKKILSYCKQTDFHQVICATVSSLKLEEERLPALRQAGIQVVDMECSAFLAAAQAIGLPAAALFWISDSINELPFYQPLTPVQKALLNSSSLKIADLLTTYCAG